MLKLYFIGIPASAEITELILSFRKKISEAFPNVPLLKTEPHITLVRPIGIISEKDILTGRISQIVSEFKAFQVNLEGVGSFGDDIVYLSAVSESLKPLQEDLAKALNAPQSNKKFFPHMTLVHGRGRGNAEFSSYAISEASKIFSGKGFRAEFLRLYLRELNGSYEIFKDFEFS